jgi:hypothetical protein
MGNSMKKITILLVIIFTFLFSTTSWGEWTYVTSDVNGLKYHYDKDRVRKNGKYLYVWTLLDLLKPVVGKYFSTIYYRELDCSILRYKDLKETFYKKSMGEGESRTLENPPDKWRYPTPNTVKEFMLNKICEEHQ